MILKIQKHVQYGLLSIGAVIIVAALVVGALYFKHNASADSGTYTCQSDNTFGTTTNSDAQLTTNDLSDVASATNWLNNQMKTSTNVVTASTITPSQIYDPSYTGAMTGTFNLVGRTYPTASSASIEIDSPTTVADSYRGVVTGKVLETPTANRWIIQAYKLNNGNESQEPVQALADGTTGDFSIDLSGVSTGDAGSWEFGILDADSTPDAYAPFGNKWPQPATYTGLEVQQKLVTDNIYDWSTTTANADGTFSFPNSNTGVKMFRLVDSGTGDILAEYVPLTGLVRSYEYDSGDPLYGTASANETFLYDQSLALYAAIGDNESTQAQQLVKGLLLMQTTSGAQSGGFVFSASQLSPSYATEEYRTGADAIAVDALLDYIKAYPNDANIAAYKTAATNGLAFIQGTLSSTGTTSGLYLGGYGDDVGDPATFDPTVVISWASTEHNVDVWQTLRDASRVLGNGTVNYQAQADALKGEIMAKLYNTDEQRLNQGMDVGGADTADPLDVNTWGAIEMYATGNVTQAQAALQHLSVFGVIRGSANGYMPFYTSAGYPDATPSLWFEGSFGAALAQYKVGNDSAYRTLLNSLETAQADDGSFVYATDAEPDYGIVTEKSVASTAWYVLATVGRNTIWNSCDYDASLLQTTTTPPTTTPPSVTTSTSAPSGIAATPTASGTSQPDTTTTGTSTSDTSTPASPTKTTSTKTTATATKAKTSVLTMVAWIGGSVIGLGIIIWLIILILR